MGLRRVAVLEGATTGTRYRLSAATLAGGVLLVLVGAAPSFAHHPMRIEQVERSVDDLDGRIHETLRVTFVNGDRKRIDTLDRVKEIGDSQPEEVRRIEIVRLDRRLVWRFDKTAGSHSERSLVTGMRHARAAPDVLGTSRSTPDLPLQRAKERKEINGHDSTRYALDVPLPDGDAAGHLRLVGELWITADVPEVHELRRFDERWVALGLPEPSDPDRDAGATALQKAGATLDAIRRSLIRSNRYPVLVDARVYEGQDNVSPAGRRRLGSLRQETTVIAPTIVFCSCTDHEKLFEFWGGFISLQLPLFQRPF